MADLKWHYEKLDEDGKIQTVGSYTNDADAKITGKHVINVKAYFDENPAERIRLGWTKHIEHNPSEVEYNKQTQFVITSTRQVDPYTVEDELHVLDKSEDQLAFEEMLAVAQDGGGIIFTGGW